MLRPFRARPALEYLEARETPAGLVETFDQAVSSALPAGWSAWSSDNSTVLSTAAGQGTGGSVGLVSSAATSGTTGRAWEATAVSGDSAVSLDVRLNSLAPATVFVRGANLDSDSPTYLAASVTRGATVQVWEVANGTSRVIGSITSMNGSYFSGDWARVTLTPTGNTVAVQLVRQDTGQYLNPLGNWQTTTTNALTVKTSIAGTSGFVGVGRLAGYIGPVQADNFQVILPGITSPLPPASPLPPPAPPPGATSASQSFDTTAAGTLPAGWNGWSNDAAAAFVASSARAASGANGLASSGSRSSAAARAWSTAMLPADVDASVSVYLDSLIPAQLFVRGSNLDTATPTYYAVAVSRGLTAQFVKVSNGVTTSLGTVSSTAYFSGQWLQVRLIAQGDELQVMLYRADTKQWLTPAGDWSSRPAYALALHDSAISTSGLAGVVRPASYTGTVAFDDFTAQPASAASVPVVPVSPPPPLPPASSTGSNPTPLPGVTIPRHYSYIRIAELAYAGNPMGATERNLLANSVDLVVSNPQYLAAINSVSPNTPQMIYTNVSNLYLELLTNWLTYADQHGISRESAFYHVAQPTAFSGASSSAQPVNWFWGVYQQTTPNGSVTNLTTAAHTTSAAAISGGAAGTTTAIGYPEKFREINVTETSGAAAGWSGTWEYPTAVDAAGNPTAWKALNLVSDGTAKLARSGRITFDPPADWVTANIGGSDRLYYVRLKATAGTAAQAPKMQTLLGRDYVNANGGQTGTIPMFDSAADKNHDGYLDDAEYARRTPGMDARFVYESRLFYPYYGQMRFITNPSSTGFQQWAANYAKQLLAAAPLASGLFVDNANGKLPISGDTVLEPTASYSTDSGALMAAVSRAIAPKWVLANTVGGGTASTPTVSNSGAALEEFLLRPLTSNWSQVGDTANLIAQRLAASGSGYVILDSMPTGGSPTDPRTQLATLAYYYLLADADRTMLMFYGGYNPSSSWAEHFSGAVKVDVGQPTGTMQVFASGKDPANPALTYRVLSRTYENALVLYKPLSYTQGVGTGTIADATAATVQLNGRYRQANADGTLGPVVTAVTLRNGEGAILVKA